MTRKELIETADSRWTNVAEIFVNTDKTLFIILTVLARNQRTTNIAVWRQSALFVRDDVDVIINSASGDRTLMTPAKSLAATTWDIRFNPHDAYLDIDVKGDDGVAIKWVVGIESYEF